MAVNHVQMCGDLTAAGFTKVTIINKSYQVLAASSQTDIASAWKSGDVTINENQELANDWNKSKDTGAFHFYKCKWGFVGQNNGSESIDCKRAPTPDCKENLLLARCREEHWIIAAGKVKGPMDKKKKKGVFKDFYTAGKAMEEVLAKYGYDEDE